MAPPGGSTRDVLHVAVLQTDPTTGSTAQNLARASALVDRLVTEARGTRGLLVAPEIGFGRHILDAEGARAAARDEGEILAWAAAVARALGMPSASGTCAPTRARARCSTRRRR